MFDLDAGPVTITLPDAGKRFMSMQVIDEDQYVPAVVYGAGQYTLTREQIGTRYVVTAIRTLVDPANPKDLEQVHKLQDAIKVEQTGRRQVRGARTGTRPARRRCATPLVLLGSTLPDSSHMFGPRGQVDPVRHLIGAAMAWGGNPEKDAIYLNVTPAKNDGKTVYRLTVKDVPVDGFWSISVYNAKGYFQPNPHERLHAQQPHGEEGRGRLGHRPVRRRATARLPTACRSRRAGTTSCASIAPGRRSSTAPGSSRTRNPVR